MWAGNSTTEIRICIYGITIILVFEIETFVNNMKVVFNIEATSPAKVVANCSNSKHLRCSSLLAAKLIGLGPSAENNWL